jgi:hypothetical protein
MKKIEHPQELIIASKIIVLREENVLLDFLLAEFYGVETRVLKQAVRRNKDRFPEDFLYELTDDEIDAVVSQNVIPSKSHFGGAIPYAFTENGVAMLSSVLKSKIAIDMNIAIMRTFTMIRKAIMIHSDMKSEMGEIKKQLMDHEDKLLAVFGFLKKIEQEKQNESDLKTRKRIGFKP